VLIFFDDKCGKPKVVRIYTIANYVYENGPINNLVQYKNVMKFSAPICTVAMAVNVICKYPERVSGCDSSPQLHSL
jgi:hypothetical protein